MKTVRQFEAGRCLVIVRDSGHVYVADAAAQVCDRDAKLVATSPAGCTALAKAFRDAAETLRECRSLLGQDREAADRCPARRKLNDALDEPADWW